MQVAGIVGAALVGLVAVIGVVFVVGMRRKSRVVLDAVRRAGRLTKGLVLRTAGSPGSSTAVVRHVGRSSGRRYETPVVAVRSAGGFAIALPYGMNTDWLKNVVASGRATIAFDGDTWPVDEPEVVAIEAVNPLFDPREQRRHRQFGVRDALRMRSAATVEDATA
jgi:deazaflavin-dependent oxidoreductase (nitroreductase family)